VGKLGHARRVFRNDAITIAEIEALNPSHIIISPGPCAPADAGISKAVITHFYKKVPMLGICLGHQAIGEVFGGKIVRAQRPMHGMSSLITHNKQDILTSIPSPVEVARYHSLVIDPNSVPKELEVTATSKEGEIMAIQHRQHPVFGLQFHPESVLTKLGFEMLQAFLELRYSAQPGAVLIESSEQEFFN
jgi:para-aminobenzoate synthetase component II